MQVSRVDIELLEALKQDGRRSFAAPGEATGLSKTSCWAQVQAMERPGIIAGYQAIIDPAALGLPLTAHVSVMADPTRRDAFEAAAINHPAIIEVSMVAGEADYLLKIVCLDLTTLDDMLRHDVSLLAGLQRSSTTICLKTLKCSNSPVAAARAGGRRQEHGGASSRKAPAASEAGSERRTPSGMLAAGGVQRWLLG